jgi:hypothetical protein
MYWFKRLMTSKSTPVVVTLQPGFIDVRSTDQVFLSGPTAGMSKKFSKTTGTVTVIRGGAKTILNPMGSAGAAAFTSEQTQEVLAAQHVAAQDPVLARLAAAQLPWVGGIPKDASGSVPRMGAVPQALSQAKAGDIIKDAFTLAGIE